MREILVIHKDKAGLREVTRQFWHAGFDVLEAVTADTAVVSGNLHGELVVAVTPLRMPGALNGLSLSSKLKRRPPGVKIVLITSFVPPGFRTLADVVLPETASADAIIKWVTALLEPALSSVHGTVH